MLPVLISVLCCTDLSWYLLCCAVLISNVLCCTGLSGACYLCLQISSIFRSLTSYRCFLLLFTLPSVLESAASDLCSYVRAGICSSVIYCMLVSVGTYFAVMISLLLYCPVLVFAGSWCAKVYWKALSCTVSAGKFCLCWSLSCAVLISPGTYYAVLC